MEKDKYKMLNLVKLYIRVNFKMEDTKVKDKVITKMGIVIKEILLKDLKIYKV